MRLTSWLAFLASFLLTLASCTAMLPEPPEKDLPSYVRGSVMMEGSALQ